MLFRHLVVIDRLVPEAFLLEAVPDFSVVMAKELGSASSHVHIVGLAFGTLLVQELVNRIVSRLILDQNIHNDEQRFPQIRRPALTALVGLLDHIAGRIFEDNRKKKMEHQ